MTSEIIQVDREDINNIVNESQYNFVKVILSEVGLPLEDCLPIEISQFTVNHKIKLRELLSKFEIDIKKDNNKLEIYFKGDCIGIWNEHLVIYKQDLTQPDIQKQLYAEIILDFWSIFETKDI